MIITVEQLIVKEIVIPHYLLIWVSNHNNDKFIIRDIPKVKKRQHQYLEFHHTQSEILKKPAKK